VVGNVYQHGTLRTLMVREPHRLRLLGGMWLAIASFVALAALIATAVSIATAFALAPSKGVDTSAWTSAAGIETLVAAAPQMTLALVGYATFGAAIAVITRSSTVAIAIAAAWLLPVESILIITLDSAADALPGQVLQAVAQGGTASIALGAAIAGALTWTLVASGVAGWLFRGRDVTS
jgi:ABC-type transport system involved in multi-copper enzyme maturation permease subunit